MSNPLKPNADLLVKLGSIIIHTEEMLSKKGHEFDKLAMECLMNMGDVKEWLKEMDKLALLPKKRP